MIRKYSLAILMVFLLSAVSCNTDKTNNTYQSYDLTEVIKVEDVKLSKILDNIHLVKFDLGEIPVTDNAKYWVGEKHIVVMDWKGVLQYSSDGTYIRKLISRGKGPDEYIRMDFYDADEEKGIFYYFDSRSPGKISRVDLDSGQSLTSLALPDEDRMFMGNFVVQNNRILVFTNNFSKVDYRFFYLTDNGEIEKGCWKKPYLDKRPNPIRATLLDNNNGKVSFTQDRDTLFELTDDTLSIDLISHGENYLNIEENILKGFVTERKLNGLNYLLLQNTELEWKDANVIDYDVLGMNYFLISRKDKSILQVKEFVIDYLGIRRDDTVFGYNSARAYIKISALELMSIIKEALSNPDIDSRVKTTMLALQNSIDENDNPYLLIGKLK